MKRWVKMTLIISSLMLVIILGLGIYAFTLYRSAQITAETIYEPLPIRTMPIIENSTIPLETPTLKSQEVSKPEEIDELKPFSMLILGVDERDNDVGRSDAMIYVAVNPNNHSALIMSIPRDTRTEIIGKNMKDKINHAYAYGGMQMSVETVEHLIGLPISYYVKTNMEGFAAVIDQLGGVTVDNPSAFQYDGYNYDAGNIHMDGDQALVYAQMRYLDPNGDFGRMNRQRLILTSILTAIKDVSTITELPGILEILKDNVKTNITWEEWSILFNEYKPLVQSIETVSLEGKGEMINDIYYYIVDAPELENKHNLFKDFLSAVD
jgi:polyisoprenyl-teichoic acid--peptidoglycan teichoic acid transferase